jgi:hypothetical protein
MYVREFRKLGYRRKIMHKVVTLKGEVVEDPPLLKFLASDPH